MQVGLIFDMDGCLLDSIKIWHKAEQNIMDEAGLELTKEQRDELNALTLAEAGNFFHERFGVLESGEAVSQAIIDYMLNFYRNDVETKPGTVEFVEGAYERGLPLCVLSSSPQSFLQAGLAHTGLKQFFADDLIISADDMGMSKRFPKTFEYVCGKLGTDAQHTWLFDDSWYALATAQGAGLRTAGIFSSDKCGTHDELARYSEIVADDFSGLDLETFL